MTIFLCLVGTSAQNAYAAVAPSLYNCGRTGTPPSPSDSGASAYYSSCPDEYKPIEHGGEIQWSVVKSDETSTQPTTGKGCPGDTKPEMSLGYIIGIALVAGLAGILAMLVFTGALLLITLYVLDGLRVACPPPHPDHPDLGAYWTHFGMKKDDDGNIEPVSKMVFAYRPCLGFPIKSSTGGDFYKGVGSGYSCGGFRIGDDCSGLCTPSKTLDDDDGLNDYREWSGGDTGYVNGVVLGVKELEDKLCLYMEAGISKVELVCQYKKEPPPPAVPSLACFMPKLCADANAMDQTKTKIPFSITATLVSCIEGTLDALFQTPNPNMEYYPIPQGATTCTGISFMERFQLIMRRSVIGLLTMYVIFYGMKIAFGVQIPQRNEFFMKLITLSLVSYFALGSGWKDYYHVLVDITNTLASNIMDTTTAGGKYCDFPRESYETGFEHNKLWDTLDCKIITYFFSNTDYPKLFVVGFYSFFGGGILILLIGIVFAIFLVLILIFAANVYIAALIGISILAFLSPIFVPMVLFSPTRKYFDGWLDEIIGFSMYPVVLFGFVALMLVSFDTFMFNERITRNADGDISFTNPKNEWLIAGTERATCNLRDRNPAILAQYTTTDDGSAMENCTTACWMYEAKLIDPTIAASSSVPDCEDLHSYVAPPGGAQPVVALCKTTGICIEGDFKPKFKSRCLAVNKTFDTEDECRAFEVCSTVDGAEVCNNPCNENDCAPQCDPDGFGCQLYKARFEGPGAVAGFSVGRFEMGTALLALLKVLGIGILFFHFLSVIGPMISEVIGNRHSSLASISVNPHAVMQKMMDKVAAAATSGASKAAKGVKSAVKRSGAGGGGGS